MKLARSDLMMIGVGVVALGLGVYVWRKGGIGNAVAGAASAAVGVAGDAAAGAVLGIGDIVGLPRTDETECQKAIREGRTWDSSFACPAGTFLGSLWDKATGTPDPYANETARLGNYNAGRYAGTGSGGVDPADGYYTDPMGGSYGG